MDIKLAAGEQIVKQWDYAKTKSQAGRSKHSLIVTDKRLISIVESKKQLSRDDFLLKEVNGVSVKTGANKTMLILGIVLCCLVVTLLFGIIFVILGRKRQFSLTIYGGFVDASLIDVGSSGGILSLFRRKKKRTKVKISGSAAEEIVDTIGSLILD